MIKHFDLLSFIMYYFTLLFLLAFTTPVLITTSLTLVSSTSFGMAKETKRPLTRKNMSGFHSAAGAQPVASPSAACAYL